MTSRTLYAANVRVWLDEVARDTGRPAGLASLPEDRLRELPRLGVDLLWLIGVWPTGPRSIEVARSHPGLAADYRRVLPDFRPQDVAGSPYAIAAYEVDPHLGGRGELARLRQRLNDHGIGLVLDFVVNHTGLDHSWLHDRPELYIQGSVRDREAAPDRFFDVATKDGPRIIAHGQDPYFPSWTDTAQLDLSRPETAQALTATLRDVASQCDAVRCDMAMLALEARFREIWADRMWASSVPQPQQEELWTRLIRPVRMDHPAFLFIAEVYWGHEDEMRRLGFQYTYDKTIYERLLHGTAEMLRLHLSADVGWQDGCLRFLETHDEPRAAAALPWDRHRAAAVIAGSVPGMTLIHDGQLDGRLVKTPVQLRRRAPEQVNGMVQAFYTRLLTTLANDEVVRRGRWRLFGVRPAWDDNPTWQHFIVYGWHLPGRNPRVIAVNFGPTQGQCYVDLRELEQGLSGRPIGFQDLLAGGQDAFVRDPAELFREGLYLDLPAFGFHLFAVSAGD